MWLDFAGPSQKHFMKKYLFVSLSILTSFTGFNQQPVDRIGVKGPLSFNKTIFDLAWTSKPTNTYYVQEYLPHNENADHFNQMLSIFLLTEDVKAADAVQQKIGELEARKKMDLTCNYIVNQSPDGKEYMVDFVIGESKNDKMEIEEFNIYRYKQVSLANSKKGLLVYAYSKRAYGDDVTIFLKNLKTDRKNLLNSMVASEIPPVTVSDQ